MSTTPNDRHTGTPDGRPMDEQPRWRQDFPIDVQRDNYVARRDFTKFMVLTSGAFAVGQLWIGLHRLIRRARGAPGEKAIASLDQLPIGGSKSFHYPAEEHCILTRPDERTLLAYNSKCTHLHCPVRPRVEQGIFECPCHNGSFDLRTGRPLAGPPRRPLHRVTIELRGDTIYATGVEVQST